MGSKKSRMVQFPKSLASNLPISASSIDVSASSGPAFPALDAETLREKIQRIVMYGTIRETRHSAEDRDYRNISQDDILAMLEGPWELSAEPDWDAKHRNWEYRISGTDLDDEPLVLKIAVNEEMQRIEIITKY